jgi:CRP-like cAMP-binding protein
VTELRTPDRRLLLATKLQAYDGLSEAEIVVLEQALKGVRVIEAGGEIVGIEQRPAASTLILEGWAARARTLEDGARQITSLHIPGDFVDLHGFLLRKMDHSVVALTACRVATAPHENLKRITEEHPHLTRLLWLNSLIDAAIHRTWIVGMGRMSAAAHFAQLICELYVRLEAVGLARDMEFDFPLTQPIVADALGLSLVHVNRALRDIRAQKLADWRSRTMTILDWDRLAAFGQFDPTYLSQWREPR